MDNHDSKRRSPGEAEGDGRAEHGSRTEVNWDGGKGSQPYQNQGSEEQGPPNGADEFAAGDRGELSGRSLEQLRQVKKMP